MPFFLVNVSPLLQHRHSSGVRCSVAESVQGETALLPHLTPESASAAELRDADSAHGWRRHRHHNAWEQLTKGCRTSPQEQGPLPQKESEKNKTGEKTGWMLTVDGLSMIANDVIFLTLSPRTKESNKNFHGIGRWWKWSPYLLWNPHFTSTLKFFKKYYQNCFNRVWLIAIHYIIKSHGLSFHNTHSFRKIFLF